MIRAFLFDFAGVIATDGYWVWLRKMGSAVTKDEKFFHALADQVDSGEITNAQFVQTLSAVTHKPPQSIWPEIRKEIVLNVQLVEEIKKLKKAYRIGMLSNYTFEWMEELLAMHHLVPLFDEIVISSIHRVIKPQPEIFHLALTKLGFQAHEAVFVDDRPVNVDAAKQLGMKAVVFTTTEQFRKDYKTIFAYR